MSTRALAVAVALAVLSSFAIAPAARGANRTFTLYGAELEGWGTSAGSMTAPGPTLTVDLNDNVTLILNSTDGPNHNWFIDYNDDGGDDANEPNSPPFQDAEISWNFTADQGGTFTYRCKFHDAMNGTMIVRTGSNPPANADNTGLIVGLAVVALVAVAAIAFLLTRKKKNKK